MPSSRYVTQSRIRVLPSVTDTSAAQPGAAAINRKAAIKARMIPATNSLRPTLAHQDARQHQPSGFHQHLEGPRIQRVPGGRQSH